MFVGGIDKDRWHEIGYKNFSKNLSVVLFLLLTQMETGITRTTKISEAATRGFLKKTSEKFCNIHKKTPVMECLFNKVAGQRACNFTRKRLQHRCFPMNISKNTYFEEHLQTAASSSSWNLGMIFYQSHK